MSEAQFYLGNLHSIGRGVPQDRVLAYVWWSLAAATAPLSDPLREQAARQRDTAAARLKSAEAERASRLIAAWWKRHPL